jgi:ElaB/YqjD/DUF883 family membrane-anchored ribosome-binding protein
MEHVTREFNRARSRIADDLKTLVDDGQELLRATANASGERIAAVQAQFAEHALSARTRLAALSRPVVESARRVDDYVHGSPWIALGAAAAAGVFIGLLASKR